VYKLLSLNFRGLLSKKEAFANVIDNEVSHFITGTESWLKPTVYSSEVFPPEYEIFCNDRPDGYGGVLLACHISLACTKIPIHTSCEVLVCKISVSRNRVLIIVTFYRPPNRDINYMQNLCVVIEEQYINFKK